MEFRSSFLCKTVSRRCDDGGMTSTTRIQRKYDHRLRELVRSTGDAEYAIQRGVPRSTARGWLTSTRAEVVTVDIVDMDTLRLQQEVLRLQNRVNRLVALLRLLIVVLKVSRVSLASIRIPEGTAKLMLLRAIERSCSVLPLRVLRLSHSRYHSWKREEECGLDDLPSCPRFSSQQLTQTECSTIKEMVTFEEYRHVPTGTMALLAQRLGKVFASSSTWYRLVRISIDFSIILIFEDENREQIPILRYNGKQPSQHTNKVEKKRGEPDVAFRNEFHIHRATERYQLARFKIDGYAEITDQYDSFDEVLRKFVTSNGFEVETTDNPGHAGLSLKNLGFSMQSTRIISA